jgi:hypothetical protein
MAASVLPPDVPGPNPGQPGHYAHHDWLTQSVHALDNEPWPGQVSDTPYVRAGQVVMLMNASGAFTITFPALPGVPKTVVYTPADPTATCRFVVAALPATWTASSVTGNCYNVTGAALGNQNVRFNYAVFY